MIFSEVWFPAFLDAAFVLVIGGNVDVIAENGRLGRNAYDPFILIQKLVLFRPKDKVISACWDAQASDPLRWACSADAAYVLHDTKHKVLGQKPRLGKHANMTPMACIVHLHCMSPM